MLYTIDHQYYAHQKTFQHFTFNWKVFYNCLDVLFLVHLVLRTSSFKLSRLARTVPVIIVITPIAVNRVIVSR
jgi:hypothetical protein